MNFKNIRTYKSVLQFTGSIWVHKQEQRWLNKIFYITANNDHTDHLNYQRNLVRAVIIGAIYTEFCYLIGDEKGMCQDEGIIYTLKTCLSENTDLSKKSIKYLAQRDLILSEHYSLTQCMANYYKFIFGGDWEENAFDDLMNTISSSANVEIKFSEELQDGFIYPTKDEKFERIGKVFQWISDGFDLSHHF